MSRSILINALRLRGEKQIEELWEEARQEIRGLEAEMARQVETEEKQCELSAGQARQAIRRKNMVSAQREASKIITAVEQELCGRLYDLAIELLSGLCTGNREEMLRCLAAEIPAAAWQKVRVHPDDAAAAGKIFPGAEIEEDPEIRGGLETSSKEGRIRMVNTIKKRLDRAWSQLGPEIIQEVAKDAEVH